MRRLLTLLSSLALILATAFPAGGVEGIGREPIPVRDGKTSPEFTPRSLDQVVDLFVQLSEPSVAAFAASGAGSQAQKAQANKVSSQQAKARSEVAKVGDITGSLRVGANGFRVDASLVDVPSLYAIEGVISVAAVTTFTVSNETSVPWVGANELAAMGFTGAGVSIGVIDTGIDYLHANFGGSGLVSDYIGNDTTILDGGFPSAKVEGGYDFVGTNYDASCEGAPGCTDVPVPDPDPLDVNGHGSHVAGTAAGLGFGAIGPGVAPGASLFALKVFGDIAGSTNETSTAIEWALDPNGDGDTSDHLDVINMSLGAPFGNPNDPTALASTNAAALGMIVVASAGNEGGDAAYVTGSPGVASGAISVAASHDGGYGSGAIDVTTGPDELFGLHPAQEGAIGPPLSVVGPVSGKVVVVDPPLGCVENPPGSDLYDPVVPTNASDLAGNIALIMRGACSFGTKHETAVLGGAIALIVYNDAARGDALLSMGFATSPIPSVFIGHTAGAAIAAAANGTVELALDASLEFPQPELTDTLVDFSSRGPGGGGTTFKPDLSAPGVGVRSTGVGTGTAAAVLSGTSMAAPHVAGMAALLRDKYPDLSVPAIKALLQNSTTPTLSSEPLARQGVGVANVFAASQLDAYAIPGGVTFGRLNPFATDNAGEKVTVTSMVGNKTYGVTVEWNQSMAGVSLSVPSSVKVREGKSTAFTAKLTLDPAAMAADDAFFSQTEVDGWIVLTSGDETLRVGFMAAIDPASAVTAQGVNRNSYQLVNHGKSLGLADGFSLVKEGDDFGLNVGAVGFRDAGGVMEFAVARTTPWNSPSGFEWDLFLDVDQDGFDDFVVLAVDLGLLFGGDPAGAVVVDVVDLNTFTFLGPFFFAFSDYNDHVISLPVPDVFLLGSDAVDYTLAVFDGDTLDGLQFGTIDVATQSSGAFTFVEAGEHLRVPQIGVPILWLYQNNVAGNQYQIVN